MGSPQRILGLSRRGPPSRDALANLLLLLWCEHFENFAVLHPLVPPEHCIRGLRAQLFVIGQRSQAGLCFPTDLINLRLLVVCERQPLKQVRWGSGFATRSQSRLHGCRRRRTGLTRLSESQFWRRAQKKESACSDDSFHERDLAHISQPVPLLDHETPSAEVPYLHVHSVAGSHPPAAVRESDPV